MQVNQTNQQYIAGQWLEGQGRNFSSINPANNTIIWHGKMATEEEISAAYSAAERALSTWALLSLEARTQYLLSFVQTVEKNRAKLTALISLETGKPLWEAATEVSSVIGKINLSIKAYQERTSTHEVSNPDALGYIRYKPTGVVAVLGPFNFPVHLSNGHIVPALLAGNTIVYKPSELTPAVAELIVQCWHQSGLPAGVINLIQGDASVAKSLLEKNIQAVYFTGSYSAGVQIHKQLAERPEVLVALEMGGNNPLVIDEVSNLDAALYQTALSAFLTAGQRCSCARRVIIPNTSFGDEFLSKFIQLSSTLRIGPFTEEPEPFMGPVIRPQHALKHLESQKNLIELGGKPLLPMSLLHPGSGFLSPGVMDMTAVTNAPDEEIFAPLIQIYRYQHFEEALLIANQTKYGLVAGLLSDSPERYQQFYNSIKAGLINWNRPTTGAASNLPFGGIGHSGNHRPSAYFAADYCAYPIASLEQPELITPKLPPGIY